MKTSHYKTPQQQNKLQDTYAGGTARQPDNRSATIVQRKLQQTMSDRSAASSLTANKLPAPRKENKTNLPGGLKSGIETLSGYNMDDVTVHYNSARPAQMQAHAYAMGNAIYLAPGQEQHLPHEAWHVVQQKQGRVKPTMQLKGKVALNDDAGLEKEADVMGEKALGVGSWSERGIGAGARLHKSSGMVMQRQKKSDNAKVGIEIETTLPVRRAGYKAIPEKNFDGRDLEVKKEHKQTKKLLQLINNKQYFEKTNEKEGGRLNKWLQALLTTDEKSRDVIIEYMYGDKSEPTPEITQIVKNLSIVFKQFEFSRTKVVVHEGAGWKAVAEKIPATVSGYSTGFLMSDTGVEIVTDPVNDLTSADNIMTDIHLWLADVLQGINRSAEREHREGEFMFEIPKGMTTQLLDNGRFKGNIQVNFGAVLEDVISVFEANKKDYNVNRENEQAKAFRGAIDLFGSNELWVRVLQEFAALKSKGSEHEYDIEPVDEPYVRNIMFQYLYMAYMFTVKAEDMSSVKNRYPILIKTPVSIQAELSDWENYQNKWNDNNNRAAGLFRSRFATAINKALIKKNKKIARNRNIGEALTVIKGLNTEQKYLNGNEIQRRDELHIGNDKYAGVFEIRYLQNTEYLQDQWLDVWKAYLDADNYQVPPPATDIVTPTQGVVNDKKIAMANNFENFFAQHAQKVEENKKKAKWGWRIWNPFKRGK